MPGSVTFYPIFRRYFLPLKMGLSLHLFIFWLSILRLQSYVMCPAFIFREKNWILVLMLAKQVLLNTVFFPQSNYYDFGSLLILSWLINITVCIWLVPSGLLSLLPYTFQAHLSKGGTAHSRWCPSSSIITGQSDRGILIIKIPFSYIYACFCQVDKNYMHVQSQWVALLHGCSLISCPQVSVLTSLDDGLWCPSASQIILFLTRLFLVMVFLLQE